MHLIVSGFGSYGDVLPMVGVGAAMRARGHRVQAVVNPYFRDIVEGAGIELLPLGTAEEYLELARHPDLWHPVRGLKMVLSYAMRYLRDVYRIVQSEYRPGETAIAAHGLDLASRILHEKCGAPLATVHFAPFAFYTVHATPRYIGAPTVSMGPRWLRRLQFYLADKWVADPLVAPEINALRADLGLRTPATRIFLRWNHSPQLVLAMFPEWFGPPQADWPPQTRLVGFPLWDPRTAPGLPDDLEEFLQAGAPPIVFAPGSANVQADGFFRTAVEACERLGRRGLMATKYTDQLPERLPPSVRHVPFVPFSLLLPRAAALVHHGGIGTCAQGLACGLPQVVMPMAYDQLDNGLRLVRLGVGAVVRKRSFRPRRVAETLARLFASTTVEERARHWAARCDGTASMASACTLLEGLLPNAPSRAPVAMPA
jgi:UDP:flavonoid glycosyltransferase YjiC (YdhE family)